MIVKRLIGDKNVFEYIHQQLAMGGTLSQSINTIAIENGEVFALVPEDTPIEKLHEYASGGIYPFDRSILKTQNPVLVRNEAKPFLVEQIHNYIDTDRKNCCLFEDANASPSDPWVRSSAIEYVHLNNKEMFYYFDRENNYLKDINDALVRSENYVFLCCLSSLDKSDSERLVLKKEINLDIISLFIKNISFFFIRAYDGEGYLLWRISHPIAQAYALMK